MRKFCTILFAAALALLGTAAFAQEVHNITLTVPSIGGRACGFIGEETIDGTPYSLAPWGWDERRCLQQLHAQLSVSANDSTVHQLAPQPYVLQPEWVQILPDDSEITRGVLPSASLYHAGSTVTSADTFSYLFTYEFYETKEIEFAGTNTRTWLWHTGYCGRGGCGKPYWVEQSAVVNMTATLLN